MKTKKSEIFLSILLLLPACLLIYQVFIKDITNDNSPQTASNNTPNEKFISSNDLNNSLQENKEITTTADGNPRNNTVNKSTDTNPQNNIVDAPNDINDATSDNNASTQNNEVNENTHIEEDNTINTQSNIENESSNISQNALKSISINSYKSNLETSAYIVKQGDTVSNILRNFEDTCNYKTAITHLKLFNPNIDLNEIEINSTLNIPTTALKEGRLYKIVSGDTWYKLAKSNYPEYNTDDIIDFLIAINDLPNPDLPLGENVFLPKL